MIKTLANLNGRKRYIQAELKIKILTKNSIWTIFVATLILLCTNRAKVSNLNASIALTTSRLDRVHIASRPNRKRKEGAAGHVCNNETSNLHVFSDPTASICSDYPSSTLQSPSKNLWLPSRSLSLPSNLPITAQGCDELSNVSKAFPCQVHMACWLSALGIQPAQIWSFVITRKKLFPNWHKLMQFLTWYNKNWHKFFWILVC